MSMELPLTVTVLKNASSEPLNRTAFLYVVIINIRTRLHKHMRTSFRQILPTLQQNYARKSAHVSYEDRF